MFASVTCALDVIDKKFAKTNIKKFSPLCSSRIFTASSITFKSLIYVKLNFIYAVR